MNEGSFLCPGLEGYDGFCTRLIPLLARAACTHQERTDRCTGVQPYSVQIGSNWMISQHVARASSGISLVCVARQTLSGKLESCL